MFFYQCQGQFFQLHNQNLHTLVFWKPLLLLVVVVVVVVEKAVWKKSL